MQRMKGWLSSKRLLIAQCEKAQRQLREAWDSKDMSHAVSVELLASNDSLKSQLHRVARERDEERRLRLEAEKKHRDIVWAWSDKQIEQAAEELRDTYLENEEE